MQSSYNIILSIAFILQPLSYKISNRWNRIEIEHFCHLWTMDTENSNRLTEDNRLSYSVHFCCPKILHTSHMIQKSQCCGVMVYVVSLIWMYVKWVTIFPQISFLLVSYFNPFHVVYILSNIFGLFLSESRKGQTNWLVINKVKIVYLVGVFIAVYCMYCIYNQFICMMYAMFLFTLHLIAFAFVHLHLTHWYCYQIFIICQK